MDKAGSPQTNPFAISMANSLGWIHMDCGGGQFEGISLQERVCEPSVPEPALLDEWQRNLLMFIRIAGN